MFFQKPLHSVQAVETRSCSLNEVKAALAASRLKVNYFCRTLQSQSCVTHDYILGGKEWWPAIVCVCVRTTRWRPYDKFTATSISWPLCSFLMLQLGQLLLRSKVTSSECMSACMCAKFSCTFWVVLAKIPWLCKLLMSVFCSLSPLISPSKFSCYCWHFPVDEKKH